MTLLLLSGCSSTAEHFDSKQGKGVLATVTRTNELLDSKLLPFQEEDHESVKALTQNNNQNSDFDIHQIAQKSTTYNMDAKTCLQRQPEKAVRVYLAPHTDDMGNFHEGSYVHTVLSKPKWQFNQATRDGVL